MFTRIWKDYILEKNVAMSCGESLNFAEYVWYSVRNWMVTERCKRYGHEYVSEDVNAECGSENLICTRCGDSWEIPLF